MAETIMKHEYIAEITWKSDGSPFTAGKYSRAHRWRFDCGIEVEASASPSFVPLPYSRAEAVDPEEAFVAAISSCHMLTFLHLASKQGVDILSYHDRAVGYMEATNGGRLAVVKVILKPEIAYRGDAPSKDAVEAIHHAAHEECFIANSVKTEIKINSKSIHLIPMPYRARGCLRAEDSTKIVQQSDEPNHHAYGISVMPVVLRRRREDEAFTAIAAMEQGQVVNLDDDFAMEAAAIGLEEGLAFAESVIFTVAKKHHAVIWTQDSHFANKAGVRFKAKEKQNLRIDIQYLKPPGEP